MRLAVAGHRVLHDPTAHAFDPQTLDPAAEKLRKTRTLAGNFQMLFRHPAWLLPARNRLWWQLIFAQISPPRRTAFSRHRLRRQPRADVPPVLPITLAAQTLFYAAAALGFLPGFRRLRILALACRIRFSQHVMTLRGFLRYLRRADRAG